MLPQMIPVNLQIFFITFEKAKKKVESATMNSSAKNLQKGLQQTVTQVIKFKILRSLLSYHSIYLQKELEVN